MASEPVKADDARASFSLRQKIGVLSGIPVFVLILMLPRPPDLPAEAHKTLAVTVLMAWWWVTEALPIPATALVPMAAFPILGIMSHREVAPNYGDSVIFLFMGGFFLAMTMQKWHLHKRIALHVVHFVGASPRRVILGFMLATAFLSMWISNTSTALMMYPIGLAVLLEFAGGDREALQPDSEDDIQLANVRKALLLGIAYAASVGGVGTLIGTPPNVIFAGVVGSLYSDAPPVEFFQWLLVGIPLVVVFLPLIWLILTRVIFPISREHFIHGGEYIAAEIKKLGPVSRGERLTLWLFAFTALALVFRRNIELGFVTLPGWSNLLGIAEVVGDTTVVMAASVVMFATPVRWSEGEFLLDWAWAVKIPWGVLLLFGGGIALADGFQTSGLAKWFGTRLAVLSNVPVPVMILSVCLLLTFLTEITSNTAITTVFMPILASTAIAMEAHPFLLMIPAAISASCAFMLPVATPPNAIIFGSGYVSIPAMARAGIFLNLLGAVLITGLTYLLAIPVFDITLQSIPAWAQ